MPERAGAERADDLVESGTDPRHLGFGDAGLHTHRLDQVVDRTGRDTVHVGLHHHRVQGLIDPPARLEDRREERALAQLRDSQFHVTGLRGQHPRSGTVAIGHPSVAAFITGSADPFSGFELDEFLQHQTDGITDQVDAITSAERVEQLGQGRLWQGHRRDLLRCVLGGTHRRSRRRPLPHRSHSATTPKPTTLRDAYRPSAGSPSVRAWRYTPTISPTAPTSSEPLRNNP